MKSIKEGEEFIMGSQVFSYRINENGGIALKVVNKTIEEKPIKETKPSKVFTPPTVDQVKDFFKEKGYSEDAAKRAYEYYTAMEWKDNNGKPVKVWKAKMIAVWFKPENKLKKETTSGISFFQKPQ
jgi:hypothetical protein